MPWSLFSECWALSQLFHSPLWLSSRGSLVPLHFLQSITCEIALCLKKKLSTLIKNPLLLKNATYYLSLQWIIIFLLVDVLKYCGNYQNVSRWCWKNGADALAQCRTATKLHCVKNAISVRYSKVKRNKIRYACKQKRLWRKSQELGEIGEQGKLTMCKQLM